LLNVLLEWHKNKGVGPKASKSKLNADSPDGSNDFTYQNDFCKNASTFDAMGPTMFTLPDVVHAYTFFLIPGTHYWRATNKGCIKTLLLQSRVISGRRRNPTPAVVIRVEAIHVDNAILLDYLTCKVALEEPESGSTHPNIGIDNNCADPAVHSGITGGSGEYEDDRDETVECDAIPTASQRRWPTTELERFDLGTIKVNGYQGKEGNNADADMDVVEDASQSDDRTLQHVEDGGSVSNGSG